MASPLSEVRREAEEALRRVLANAAAIVRLSWSDGATPSDRANLERIKSAAADIAQDHKILRALLASEPAKGAETNEIQEARAVAESAPELNLLNYTHDEVAELNEAMVRVTLLLRRAAHPAPPAGAEPATPGRTSDRLLLDSHREALATSEADVARLTALLHECNAVCLCGCPESEHESYGEDGESCGHDDHECIRVAPAVLEIVQRYRVALSNALAQKPASDEVREAAEALRSHIDSVWAITPEEFDSAGQPGVAKTIRLARRLLAAIRANASPAPVDEGVREAVSENDVYTLIGHAEYLRKVRGEEDMPKFFDGLARRLLAVLRGGQKGGE